MANTTVWISFGPTTMDVWIRYELTEIYNKLTNLCFWSGTYFPFILIQISSDQCLEKSYEIWIRIKFFEFWKKKQRLSVRSRFKQN
jgi:hypothetical protein